MAKSEINVDIKPTRTTSAYVVAPYDRARQTLTEAGYKEIDLQKNARLRMQQGKDAFVSRNGNWVKEDVIYVPNKGKLLTKVSHISSDPKQATDCHRNGEDFYLTPEQVEESLADSVLLSVKEVPTNRFADCDITVYAFGEDAQKYGEFLRDVGIKAMPIWTTDFQEKPFARKLWFSSFDGRSDLGGCSRDLNYGRARGVYESAEGTAPNFEAYTPK